jgi:diguanylate cyclase (GGDEF)-like protein
MHRNTVYSTAVDFALDPRSIAATVTLSGLLLAAVLAVAHRDARHVPGVLAWMWGCIAVSVALGQNAWISPGYQFATYVVGNVLLNCAVPLIWVGVRQFAQRSAPRWPVALVAVFSAVWGYLFAIAMPNHVVRVAVFSVLIALWCMAACYEFLRIRDRALRVGTRLAGLPLLLFAVLMLARAVEAVLHGAPSSPAQRAPVNTVAFLGGSLVLMSTMIGIIICINARLASEIRRLAYEDMLTGALSRRGLYDALPKWLQRHGQGAYVALIDLDYFKAVNDRLGHSAGDALLRILVATCKARLPAGGLLARLGGDEFVLLLPAGASPHETTAGIARAFSAAAQAGMDLSAFDPKPAATMGFAPLQGADLAAFDTAIRHADAALYQQKGARGAPQRYLRASEARG